MRAKAILGEVEETVSTWREAGRAIGMLAVELEQYADAFEHDERIAAQKLIPPPPPPSREATKAVAYLRTSSKTNIGAAKAATTSARGDQAYAKANGFEVVATFYDAAVSGADPVTDRAGFAEMLERLLSKARGRSLSRAPTVSPET